MRVLLLTTQLGGGGAERHTVRIANALAQHAGVEPQVGLIRGLGEYARFLAKGIPVGVLAPSLARRSTGLAAQLSVRPLTMLIKRERPDVIISFLQPATWVAYRAVQGLARDARPHRIASVQNHYGSAATGLWQRFRRDELDEAVATADHIVSISRGVLSSIVERLADAGSRSSVIYNAATEIGFRFPELSRGRSSGHFREAPSRLVACGRLVPQKGFDLLLPAFAKIRSRHNCKLTILGEGPNRNALQRQIENLGLAPFIEMPGFVDDPLAYFRRSDLFVLSSRWEGFGNVVVESMSVGTPVVAMNCPFGPNEIITHGVNGWLSERVSADALERVLEESFSHRAGWLEIAASAQARARDFTAEAIGDQYLKMIEDVIAAPRVREGTRAEKHAAANRGTA